MELAMISIAVIIVLSVGAALLFGILFAPRKPGKDIDDFNGWGGL